MEDLRPEDPRQLGDYQLLARIGSGGMGQVFLAQSQGGRPLAIKVIRPELAGDGGFRKRFSQEVASARSVNGLYTALVVDADADGAAPWLATVYVPGPSLAEAVDEHGPLPVESVRTLAAGLAESLKAIHTAGIVHRDLKPSNVLLAEDGPRVIDFGIARALESSSLTASGVIVGTVAFMSPEQVQGGTVGPPSDIFSLGAVLVFAACGEGPFGTGTPSAMLYRVVHNAPDTSKVPDQLRSLIDRCLARDPSDRPSTAELLADLRTARSALNWLPAGLTHIPGQERHNQHNTAYQETETTRTAQDASDGTRRGAFLAEVIMLRERAGHLATTTSIAVIERLVNDIGQARDMAGNGELTPHLMAAESAGQKLLRALRLNGSYSEGRLRRRVVRAEDAVSELYDGLRRIPLDVSGLDVSSIVLPKPPEWSRPPRGQVSLYALEGVVWTDETTWPSGYKQEILSHSRTLRKGVYQVEEHM
jgi:hypothetical protein